MILRRITEHVKAQNWTAVGLDFVIVVAGVFLGLQVANWNDARQDQRDSLGFLQRIHEEILAVERSSARVRLRRLNLIAPLEETAKALFADRSFQELDDEHCKALATSHYFHISIPEIPSLVELTSAGRVSIIDDEQLRTALISTQQSASGLRRKIQNAAPLVHNLPVDHPMLISSQPYFDDQLGEMEARYVCDFQAMLNERSFLNKASENIDGYDVYLRDGLRPWNEQLERAHRLIDTFLKIDHDAVDR